MLDKVPPATTVINVGLTMPLLDVNIDSVKKVYEVNVFGVISTVQVFSPLVMAAEGTIVIIGSIAGFMPYVFGGSPPRPLVPHN
jgi:1-acylglycerone phosphate reductase